MREKPLILKQNSSIYLDEEKLYEFALLLEAAR
jgi:hypothetical protein